MVGVGHGVAQIAIGLGAHDGLGFVGNPPTRQRIRVEHGNAVDFTAGRQAQHAHVARVATGPEAVVFIELTRRRMHRGRMLSTTGGGRSTCSGTRGRRGLLLAGGQANGQASPGQTGQGGGIQKLAARQISFNIFVLVVGAHCNLPKGGSTKTGQGPGRPVTPRGLHRETSLRSTRGATNCRIWSAS